jgi:hypothetical protein
MSKSMIACPTKHRLTLSATGNCMRNPELQFHIGVSSIRQTQDSTGDSQELGEDHVEATGLNGTVL